MSEAVAPAKIDLAQWSRQFASLSDDVIRRYTYYNNNKWGLYLSPPATFMVYGARELKRLEFDNSLAALRLWGFTFNESERLFRARQSGMRVIATMGDLGTVPVIVMAFPGCIPFYPDCTWWTPFFNESTVLLDKASELGAPEASCFVRSSLSAFYKQAYFPKPDALFASTGASCDDYSAVMQMIQDLGHDVTWLEIPYRRKHRNDDREQCGATAQGFRYAARFANYLADEYRRVWEKMRMLTGKEDIGLLAKSIEKANRLRRLVADIKKTVSEAEVAPLPALEMMVIEFGNLYGYGDIDEWSDIVQMVHDTVRTRVDKGIGVLDASAVPIAWITPTADPILLNIAENLGARVVETEYVIDQAHAAIDEDIDPFLALARSFMNASLIGSTSERISRILDGVDRGRIRGVIVSNMLGCSHCAMETRLIEEKLKNVPVLSIDVPAPMGITEQLKTRFSAFMETLL